MTTPGGIRQITAADVLAHWAEVRAEYDRKNPPRAPEAHRKAPNTTHERTISDNARTVI